MYGAVVERGIIRAADQKKYIVETLDRKGIESLQITALNGAPFAVGDIVYFFLFPDGTGKIICSEAANDTTGFVVDANYVHTDNNYTDDEKAKLSDIEAEAQKNVQSDWNAESGDAFIKNKPTIPTKVSELENDSKFVDSDGAAAAAPVTTVNDKKGDVKLGKSDVGLGSVTNERQYSAENPPPYPVTKVNNKTGDVSLGKSDVGLGSVANERQYSAENPPPYPVTKVNNKTGDVSLGKSDVGLGNVENVKQYSSSNPPPYPVTKVNNKTGAVTLGKSDVGLGNVDNVKQYSASNPPPYPVTSVNGKTGAVTIPQNESGSGYCKMPDGTLICWGSFETGTHNANAAWGTLYETPAISVSVSFPSRFSDAPNVWYKCRTRSSQCFLEDSTIVSTTGIGGSIYLYRPTSATVSAFVQWLAVGRWK